MVKPVRFGCRARTAALFLALWVSNPLAPPRAYGAAEQSDSPSAPVARGQRVFTCGHSFHVFAYRLVGEMAQAAGFDDHQSVGLSAIGGSRVIQHWDVPEAKNELNRLLQELAWDAVTQHPRSGVKARSPAK